jgi:hypothetical protein
VNATNLSFSAGTLNTIQNIATSSSPLFTGLTIAGSITNSSLTQNALVYSTSAFKLASATVNSTNLSFSGGALNTIQNIATTSSPTFANLIDSGLTASAIVYANGSNQLSSVTVGGNLAFIGSTLTDSLTPTYKSIDLYLNTPNTLVGVDSSSTTTSIAIGANLTLSGGTLSATAGNNFYGFQYSSTASTTVSASNTLTTLPTGTTLFNNGFMIGGGNIEVTTAATGYYLVSVCLNYIAADPITVTAIYNATSLVTYSGTFGYTAAFSSPNNILTASFSFCIYLNRAGGNGYEFYFQFASPDSAAAVVPDTKYVGYGNSMIVTCNQIG